MIITIIRKPPIGSIYENTQVHQCGGINIDGTRISHDEECKPMSSQPKKVRETREDWIFNRTEDTLELKPNGRWPANVFLTETSANILDSQSGISISTGGKNSMGGMGRKGIYGSYADHLGDNIGGLGDKGGASRYFKKVEE